MTLLLITFLLFLILPNQCHSVSNNSNGKVIRPNIVVIIIDDWGWNNWGIHAQNQPNHLEIRTPNLDSLAREGIIFDRFYTSRMCAPARSSFWTGRNSIHVNAANAPLGNYNLSDPISGFEGPPIKMTLISQKLQDAGYDTAIFGKWDVGQATPKHFPKYRGFDRALTTQSYSVDPWTYTNDILYGYCDSIPFYTDLWEDDHPAYSLKPKAECSGESQDGCAYIDEVFANETIKYIKRHKKKYSKKKPLFVTYSTHAQHQPLFPSKQYTDKFSKFIDNPSRANYSAMLAQGDDLVGRIVNELKAQDMWDNTFLVVFSDNGGALYFTSRKASAASNNYPLLGGKFSNTEGGIRVNAFISGGAVPLLRRGATENGYFAIEDWYATFCAMAGCDAFDEKAAKYNLPPVDSINMYPLIMGECTSSPRAELVFSALVPMPTNAVCEGTPTVQALIDDKGYKLIIGNTYDAFWQGPFYPNATSYYLTINPKYQLNCGGTSRGSYPYFNEATQSFQDACLFNILSDPTEHNNIARQNPDIVKRLSLRMKEINATAFNPNRGSPTFLSCNVSSSSWHGFLGPFIFKKI